MDSESAPLLGKMPPTTTSRLVDAANRYLVGVALLLGVVILWTASNFITASLETGENSWNKPFLITYLNTASFALYLLPTLWKYHKGTLPAQKSDHRAYQRISQDAPQRRSTSLTRLPASPRVPVPPLEPAPIPPFTDPPHVDVDVDIDIAELDTIQEGGERADKLSIRETAEVAAWWSAVWFVANWAVNASLAWTSVASVTILSSTSGKWESMAGEEERTLMGVGFFTLALGRVCGVESLTRTKVFAVVASFLGVLLVTRSDSTITTSAADTSPDLPSHPILGDLAALLSASFYAVYVVFLKVRVKDEERADMQLMLGFAGLFNIVCLIPVFPLLHWLGWETFELPPTRDAWTICLINMCITLSSDYLYVLAMLKTTPMLVTIGLSLTIPLALIGSLFIPSSSADAITVLSLSGAALVVAGFVMLGWQGWEESQAQGGAVTGRDPSEVEAEQDGNV
ncbi:hypothetical protein JCM24511_00212 [Saitozyma sp. JCM 24511]|nr:hypothetical protein JCM24511_00212 [Saitozyma sp. JCM 24511]